MCQYNWKEYFDEKYNVRAHRLRSGHVPLNKFLHLKVKITSPNCVECNIVEDVHNFSMERVKTRAERETLVIVVQSILSKPLSEAALLVNKFFEVYSVLHCFAKKYICLV